MKGNKKKINKIKVVHNPLKRTFDILFSLIALTFGMPIFLAIALAIRLTDKGKVFYAHTRIGRGGKPIKCLKFRTMRQDADEILKKILNRSISLVIASS